MPARFRAPLLIFILAAALLPQTTRSVWDGVYTQEQSKRGQAVFAKQCASCHSPDLSGGESAPPLAGADFLSDWAGMTVADLFERTRTSMPLNTPGKLTRQEYADLVACILSANHFPAGKTELDNQTEPLKQIRLEAEKPK